MSITPFAAVASLMLHEGWEEVGRGDRGVLLGKGEAQAPVPYALRVESQAWTNLLIAIAQVEGANVNLVRSQVDRLLVSEHLTAGKVNRAELDLHLEGPGVSQHETSAYEYGRFVAKLAETVKELVKDASGLRRYARELQIVGGAREGSVAVNFREPVEEVAEDQSPLPREDENPLPKYERGATPERGALLSLSQIMNASEEAATTPGDTGLDAHLNLNPSARRSIAGLASIMLRAGWTARGYVAAPGLDAVPVALSLAGALRLRSSASVVQKRVMERRVHGELDGWTWSTANMHFIADGGELIKAAVPMILQGKVASLNASERRDAVGTFQVLEQQAPNGGAVSRTFALAELEADVKPTPLDAE